MEEIANIVYENGKLELSSDVFVSMYKGRPEAVIWKEGHDVHITDHVSYSIAKYCNDNIKKLYETTDPEIVFNIYEATAYSYRFELEERVARLLSVIGGKKLALR